MSKRVLLSWWLFLSISCNTFIPKPAVAENLSLSFALWGAPERKVILGTLYRFRDEVLTQSPKGRRYIRLFYLHALEGTWLLLRHPNLRTQSRNVLRELLPTIQAVTDGQPAALTSEKLAAIEGLMDAFSAKATPRLQRTIQRLRSELSRGKLLSHFGIEPMQQ